jgi:hypothetical protein
MQSNGADSMSIESGRLGQRLVALETGSNAAAVTPLAFLSALFSLIVLPGFLAMVCRGDLSDIAAP